MTEIPRKITPFAARPRTRGEKLAGRKRGLGGQADSWAALTAEEDAAGQSRLMAAASQLHDRAADTRVLGVQALVQLADESDVFRQQCIDLLCAAVRERPGVFPEGPAGTGRCPAARLPRRPRAPPGHHQRHHHPAAPGRPGLLARL